MTDQSSMTNQTRFSDEAVYFESVPPEFDPNTPKKSFLETKQGKAVLIFLAIFGFLLVVIGLAIVAKSNQEQTVENPTDTTAKPQRELSETEKKVMLLKESLVSADPTKEQDPFPPINLKLRLDPSEK